MREFVDRLNTADPRNKALALLSRAGHWDLVLPAAGYRPIGENRWQGRTGDRIYIDDAAGHRVAHAESGDECGHWAENGVILSVAFAKLIHGGDREAAAADLFGACDGGPSTQAARSLPPELLAEIAEVRVAGPKQRQDRPERQSGPRLVARKVSEIASVPQIWLWLGMVPAGELTLVAGREGVGKSTFAYQLAADVTRGGLPGTLEDQPKAVLVVASEDSWASTIKPRLVAANADLDLVHAVFAEQDGLETPVQLVRDREELRELVEDLDVGLLLFDPIMSRLDGNLDTHRDADVRRGLEPLVTMAHETGVAVVGLIHVNKSASADPLTTVMASRAFTAIARAVLYVAVDPADSETRYVELVKSNLSSTSDPGWAFKIVTATVKSDDGRPIEVGKLDWIGESEVSVTDLLRQQGSGKRTRLDEASEWLQSFMRQHGGSVDAAVAQKAAKEAGFAPSLLARARKAVGLQSDNNEGFPRTSRWSLLKAAVND